MLEVIPSDNQGSPSLEGEPTIAWPPKKDLFGVRVSVTTYEELVDCIVASAKRGVPAMVSLFSVHSLMTASNTPALREKVNEFQAIGPDGQPVRWALNWLHRADLPERVYGPETMLRICREAAAQGVPIYLYGSTQEVLDKLRENLVKMFPELLIVGVESPPFRDLTDEEADALVARVNGSGAGIFFVGLGCPKQDYFVRAFGDRLRPVQVAVGAAFDFHAGTKPMAPAWMQKRGLEWLYRLCSEPRRLWKRYFVTNSQYLWKLMWALMRRR